MRLVAGKGRRLSATIALAICAVMAVVVAGLVWYWDGGEARAQASNAGEQTIVKTGHIDSDRPDWVYEPFEVPRGVTEISVRYEYNREGGNALDIGAFDPDGYDLGNAEGFRGWSGGARSEFTISRSAATPGYVPGKIEPGTWNIIFGPYQVAPGGIDWKATITLRSGDPGPAFEPDPAPARAQGRGPAWYRGDLHLHTVHSDGSYTPEELVAGADAAGLDFMLSSEHNTPTANSIWGEHARPDLLIINGEEITTRGGHWNAMGLKPGQWVDWRYRPEDGQLPRFVRQVHNAGGLAIVAHPYCPFKGCDWRFGYEGMDAIEVWNGPWTPDDEASVKLWEGRLREGEYSPVAGGASDAHRPGQTIGLPQTVVRADDLSRKAIIAGVGEGRSYVAESSAVAIKMKATTEDGLRAGIGGRVPSGRGTPVTVGLRVRGAQGTVATFHTEDGVVKAAPIPDGDETVTYVTRARETEYVRV
ncbi:MAG: CehA/McbA family metallohydrolase, partial [Rubrobacter sp.]